MRRPTPLTSPLSKGGLRGVELGVNLQKPLPNLPSNKGRGLVTHVLKRPPNGKLWSERLMGRCLCGVVLGASSALRDGSVCSLPGLRFVAALRFFGESAIVSSYLIAELGEELLVESLGDFKTVSLRQESPLSCEVCLVAIVGGRLAAFSSVIVTLATLGCRHGLG